MRITVKVGTSTLAHATGRLNIQRMEGLCKVLSDLKNAGHEIILVSSGAIGMGVGKLNLPGRPKDMPTKQAAAAVGQCELMYTYDKLFNEYNHTVAQVLLTGEDVKNEQRSRNMRNTIFRLLELGAADLRLTQEELQNLVYNAKNCERARKAIKKLREEISASKANIREYDRQTLDLTRQRKDMETANTGLVASILETGHGENVESIIRNGQKILTEQPELYDQIMEVYEEQTGQTTAHPMETEEPELG